MPEKYGVRPKKEGANRTEGYSIHSADNRNDSVYRVVALNNKLQNESIKFNIVLAVSDSDSFILSD